MDNQNDPNNIPTLADIVRRETNNGALIVGFYLDVVEGNRDEDGFEACHRMEAAEQLQAVAPDLVAEFIEVISGEKCVHAQRRSPKRIRRRKPRDPDPVCTGDCRSHNRHEAIEYLASALDAPSITDDPRVTGIVRASTDHGKVAVSYLLNVMKGAVQGFGPHHRMRAAQELIAHIARDELRTQSDSVHAEPVEAPDPAEGPETESTPSVIPAKGDLCITKVSGRKYIVTIRPRRVTHAPSDGSAVASRDTIAGDSWEERAPGANRRGDRLG